MRFSKNFIYIILFFVLFLTISGSMFIVNQAQQAIVLQFGEPKQTYTVPGLKFKIPFINDVIYYDARVLNLDPRPEEMILSDQKRIIVDSFARYKIRDPLKFYQRARTVERAFILLTQQLTADLNKTVAKVNFDVMLSDRRIEVMDEIMSEMRESAAEMGIEVLDIRIRRADVPQQISEAIYNRMMSERERIARQYRALGEERAQAIKAEADRQATVIVAQAKKEGEQLRGEGDGMAAKIYADSYARNPGFYKFYRQLRAYQEALADTDDKPTFVVDPKKFKFLSALT